MANCPKCGELLSEQTGPCPVCGEIPSINAKQSAPPSDRWTFTGQESNASRKSGTSADNTASLGDDPSSIDNQARQAPYTNIMTDHPSSENGQKQSYDQTITVAQEGIKSTPQTKGRTFIPTPTATLLSKSIKPLDKSPTVTAGEEAETSSASHTTKEDPIKTPPLDKDKTDDEFYIESDSVVQRKATAPQLLKIHIPDEEQANETSAIGQAPRGSAFGIFRVSSFLSTALVHLKSEQTGPALCAAAILLGSWIVPDVWAEQSIFAHDRLNILTGWKLAALVAKPTVGACLLASVLLPLAHAIRAIIGLALGLVLLGALVALAPPPLATYGLLVCCLALLSVITGAAALVSRKYRQMGTLAVSIVPAILFTTALVGWLAGKIPGGNLLVFKSPLEIFAGMLVTTHSAAFLIGRTREQTPS